MPTWLGQLVISKGSKGKSLFKVQYWRTPSTTPALIAFSDTAELKRYLRHCRLSGTTPEAVVEQLKEESRVTLSTLESEEAVS